MKCGEFMKLKHDCVRNVLLAIEAHDEINSFLFDTTLKPMLMKTYFYLENDLNYTVLQLIDAGFLDAESVTNGVHYKRRLFSASRHQLEPYTHL